MCLLRVLVPSTFPPGEAALAPALLCLDSTAPCFTPHPPSPLPTVHLHAGDAALAPALLCLDSTPLLGQDAPFTPADAAATRGAAGAHLRLSPAGCSILIQLLRYGQGACRAFTDSVAQLPPNDAARWVCVGWGTKGGEGGGRWEG